ncbi:MAG: hypothetical protein KGQ43_09750 [Acidobacteria bacterium]|nr:hypothetical protein [Acidobacteriota bacterium]
MTSLIGANMADIPDPLEWTTRLDLDPSWDEPVVKKDLLVLSLRLDQRFNRIDIRFEKIERRLELIEQRLNLLEARFDSMDLRFDALVKRMDRFEERLKSSRNLTHAHIVISALAVIVPFFLR